MIQLPPRMMPLSPTMFRFACHMAHLAERDAFEPKMALPMAAVIHSAAALEAFLNEELAAIKVSEDGWSDTFAALDRADVDVKWMVIPKLLFGKTFDRGSEPFQAFKALVRLRNALTHYKPEFKTGDSTPSFVRELEARFNFTSPPVPDDVVRLGWEPMVVAWLHRVLNRECAHWSCKTARDMVLHWHTLRGDAQGRALAEWTWSLNFLEGKPAGEPPDTVKTIRVDAGKLTVIDLQELFNPSGSKPEEET